MKKYLMKMLMLALMMIVTFSTKVVADSQTCDGEVNKKTYYGTNENAQEYGWNWSSVIQSYIVKTDDKGLMRVQADAVDGKILVEYYDKSFNFKSSKLIAEELAIFGGFYATDTNYFILSGQTNPNESDNVEVFRITKYDKNWKRIASCGLYGANTYIPFDAGSARMTSSGKYLLIRTAHEMYASDDGYHHQANVTIQVDMDEMKVTDSFTDIMNYRYGYVSHSFNQFIKTEGNNIVAVDHGDAYPRSIALLKYNTDFTTGKFVPDYGNVCDKVDMLTFPGNIGANYTGATVGGFEISKTSYIVAGTSVEQENNYYGSTKNVFVSVAKKDTGDGIGTPVVKWITSYKEGTSTARTPHLVKISDTRFLLIWSRDTKVYYVELNENGDKVGQIYSFTGSLSDCAPIVINNRVVWYVWNNEKIVFCGINATDISRNAKWDNVYKVAFDANGGKAVSPASKNYVAGSAMGTLPVPTRAGYSFNGWYTAKSGGTKVTSSTLVKKDMTIYAQWRRNLTSSNTTVTLSVKACYYDGKIKKPAVKSVKFGSVTLKEGTDYKVSYSNNQKIGTAYAVITGIGKYAGMVKKSFYITPKQYRIHTVGSYKYKVTDRFTVAFAGLSKTSVTNVTIASTVNIGGRTFKVTAVAAGALKGNTKVTSVLMGTNIKSINANAFYGCSKLGSIKIKSTVLKAIGSNAFKGIKSTAKISVPSSKLTAYKKLFKGKGQSSKVVIVKY